MESRPGRARLQRRRETDLSRSRCQRAGFRELFGELELSPLQKAWIEASDEMMKDKVTKADVADKNFLNHAIWYSATDWKRPYPGETEIMWPDYFVKAAAEKARGE
jgi:hypothetical protein